MKRIFLLFILIIFSSTFYAQTPAKYWVQFKDKEGTSYSVKHPEEFLSPRAIEKRQRFNIPITEQDLPVSERYVQQLLAIDPQMVLLTKSKWLNGVTVYTTTENIADKIRKLEFVTLCECTALMSAEESFDYPINPYTPPTQPKEVIEMPKEGTDFEYGYAGWQIGANRAQWLHRLGAHGEGMLMVVMDVGFQNTHKMPAFNALRDEGRLLGTRNFVQPGRSVFISGSHGTEVLSCIAAYLPDEIVGTAPKASFYLAKTEDSRSENKIEEDNWVAGLEWADSLGCDVLSSSLGYHKFDNKNQSYTYEDMNGHVSRATQAAAMAASRGIIVCVSAGNEGDEEWKYITSPADADSILTIGAITRDYQMADFSSYGPTYDGRVKPDGLAIGAQAIVVTPSDEVNASYGTSFSAPIFAGMVTCLWQLFPDKTPMEVIDAVQRAGGLYSAPNDQAGYGITNFVNAYNHLARSYDASVLTGFDATCNSSQCYGIYFARLGASSFKVRVTIDGTNYQSEQVIPVKGKTQGDFVVNKFKIKLPKCKKGEYYAIARVQIICPEGITYEQVIGLLPK